MSKVKEKKVAESIVKFSPVNMANLNFAPTYKVISDCVVDQTKKGNEQSLKRKKKTKTLVQTLMQPAITDLIADKVINRVKAELEAQIESEDEARSLPEVKVVKPKKVIRSLNLGNTTFNAMIIGNIRGSRCIMNSLDYSRIYSQIGQIIDYEYLEESKKKFPSALSIVKQSKEA